jgi:activator of 2-hydroxyglutaryl-CoA dehydratase
MIGTVGIHGEVTMSGGVAKNKGVVALMEEKLGKPIRVYQEPQIVGPWESGSMMIRISDR